MTDPSGNEFGFPDLVLCFSPDPNHGSWAYASLVAATIFTLLLTLFLTFTDATKPEKQAQLIKKHIARPKCMTTGSFLVFFCSKLGLACLTTAAASDWPAVLAYDTEQAGAVDAGKLQSFQTILPVIFALAMAGMLTNEFARLTDVPKERFSAARSANGIITN